MDLNCYSGRFLRSLSWERNSVSAWGELFPATRPQTNFWIAHHSDSQDGALGHAAIKATNIIL
eukprot:scaffold1269_cov136-Skeletonema_marinoi.AAC.1